MQKLLLTLVFFTSCQLLMAQGKHPRKEPNEILVDHIIEALKKEDAALYMAKCMPSPKDFDLLMKATYAGNPEILNTLNTPEAIDSLKNHIKNSFIQLIEKGKAEGIEWSKISHNWTGISGTMVDKISQINIPFQFFYNATEYRVVLDYCTQLVKKESVILPGAFKWEGAIKKN